MRYRQTLSRFVKTHKDKAAIIFSCIALISSFGTTVVEFCVPTNQLTMVVSVPNYGDNEEAFTVSREDGKLRLDPSLHLSFINGSPNNILIKFIELVSPLPGSIRGKAESFCESSSTFSMQMDTFAFSNGDSRKAAPFAIAPGEVTPIQIKFAGIPDITKDINIKKGIPIGIHIEIFDFKGRHHDFCVRAFEITSADENSVTYDSELEDKGVAVLRFSRLWSTLH